MNDLACSSLGFSREALLGMQPSDYSDVPTSPEAWREMVACIEREGVAVFEAKHRHRNGTFIEVEVKATRVQAGLDRLIVTVARDITERKLAEARLIEERNKAEAIMAATGDGITVQDLDFRIIYQNEVLIQRRGQHFGEPCYRVYAKRDRVCDDCQAQKSIAEGRPLHHDDPRRGSPAPGDLRLPPARCRRQGGGLRRSGARRHRAEET